MKLRFDHQSIRLRVRKSDLEKLSREHLIEETVCFPQGVLVYQLEISQAATALSAAVHNTSIKVTIPASQAVAWIESDEVGIYATLVTSERPLDVIIEKDFPCKHGSSDDNADTFQDLDKG